MFKVSQLAGFGAGVVGTPTLDKLLLESGDFLLLEDAASRFNLDTGAIDPYFSNVVLLLSLDGTDGDTTIADLSSSNHSVTFVNQAELDDVQKKFGDTSLVCDGVDDGVSMPDSEDWNLGSGQFTAEAFIRMRSFTARGHILGHFGNTSDQQSWQLTVQEDFISFRFRNGGLIEVSATPNVFLDRWHHVVADRDSSNDLRLYLDGVVVNTRNTTETFQNVSVLFTCGKRDIITGQSDIDGWIDEVRVTKGVARYAGAFTPPDNPFPRA